MVRKCQILNEGYSQLEKLYLAWLSSVDNLVERAGGKSRNLARRGEIQVQSLLNDPTICITPCFAAALVKFSSPSG
jgi:hypothetical protein